MFGFLNFYIAEKITLKAVLTSFIKHQLSTLFRQHRGLLMGRIKKKKNNYTVIMHLYNLYNYMYKNLMERYFALKITFLIFWRPKNSVLKVS